MAVGADGTAAEFDGDIGVFRLIYQRAAGGEEALMDADDDVVFVDAVEVFGFDVDGCAADGSPVNAVEGMIDGAGDKELFQPGAGGVAIQSIALRNAMNAVTRNAYADECTTFITQFNRFIENEGFEYRFALPSQRFNRGIGSWAGVAVNPQGEIIAPTVGDAPDAEDLRLRRKLLTWHQGLGLGLLGLELATTAVGQLNYRDKFGTPANTGKWRAPHAALAIATTAAFAVNAGFALAAPAPVKREWKLDRVMVHRIALFTASAGMLTQVGLGFYTSSREGYVNQRQMAKTHLYVGYGTLAAILTGVGVIVF